MVAWGILLATRLAMVLTSTVRSDSILDYSWFSRGNQELSCMGFLGHTCSFLPLGMHYDKNGNYFGWWTNFSKNAFEKKSHCLGDQYSNYTIFGKHVSFMSIRVVGVGV